MSPQAPGAGPRVLRPPQTSTHHRSDSSPGNMDQMNENQELIKAQASFSQNVTVLESSGLSITAPESHRFLE